MKVYEYLLNVREEKGAGYLVLIDPDSMEEAELSNFSAYVSRSGADAMLVGGSLLLEGDFNRKVKIIKRNSTIPVILFPGTVYQLSPHADAVLFLSLISGRNPHHLIGEQVLGAPIIKKMGLEPISTGYMLIESGRTTSAEFMSNTKPIPSDKLDISLAHALAAEYMGMKFVYLEAGSGAKRSIPNELIKSVCNYINVPVIVGGGIKTPGKAAEKVSAGASFVVTGNVLEEKGKSKLIDEFGKAIHYKLEK